MLESKKYIYHKYKNVVEFICKEYDVDISVGIDMVIANLSKAYANLSKAYKLVDRFLWYDFPYFKEFIYDYEHYFDLVERERGRKK